MKMKNSFSFITNILYKIFEDCVLLSNKLRNRNIRVEDINVRIKEWFDQLEQMPTSNSNFDTIKIELINELINLKSSREVLIYDIWNMQNKIESLAYVLYNFKS